jgi:hypothetical protein
MEEIMSAIISAIKRFIEDWVEGKPRLVHYESKRNGTTQKGAGCVEPNSELGQLKEIPVPADYQGEPPQRIKDYLTGFKMAWEIAIRMQQGHALNEPRPLKE